MPGACKVLDSTLPAGNVEGRGFKRRFGDGELAGDELPGELAGRRLCLAALAELFFEVNEFILELRHRCTGVELGLPRFCQSCLVKLTGRFFWQGLDVGVVCYSHANDGERMKQVPEATHSYTRSRTCPCRP